MGLYVLEIRFWFELLYYFYFCGEIRVFVLFWLLLCLMWTKKVGTEESMCRMKSHDKEAWWYARCVC